MLIELSVFDAYEKLIQRSTIDTELSLSLLQQIEEISPFVKWQKLVMFDWRKGKILQKHTLWSANGANRIQDYQQFPKQLDFFKRNCEALTKEKNIDFYTLELQEKSQRELEKEYIHTDVQCQKNPYLVTLETLTRTSPASRCSTRRAGAR
jgi:hypothetical protein